MRRTGVILGAVAMIVSMVALGGCEPPSVEVRPTPISVSHETVGTGREAKKGDIVTIDYRIQLPNGEEVLSAQGYRFQVGRNAVIAGIDQSVQGMRIGGTRVINCPPHWHWGRQGYGDGAIPPNTTLRIEMRLTDIN